MLVEWSSVVTSAFQFSVFFVLILVFMLSSRNWILTLVSGVCGNGDVCLSLSRCFIRSAISGVKFGL